MAPPFQRTSLWTLAFCCALRLLTMCVCGRGVGGVFFIMARVECFHTALPLIVLMSSLSLENRQQDHSLNLLVGLL